MTTAGCYRDKLGMRVIARAMGYLVPEFCRVLNLRRAARLHGTRSCSVAAEAALGGIGAWHSPHRGAGAVVAHLDDLGDEQSHYLLEQFVPGDIFHVDSIVSEGEVKFQAVHRYGRPPMQVMHDGGVFTTRTVDRREQRRKGADSAECQPGAGAGMLRGVTHAEYIRAHADGRYYFLEIAARVGGAFICDLVEAATGVNLWRNGRGWRCVTCAENPMRCRTRSRPMQAACCAWPRPRSRTRPV